ncbi:FAD/FMN-containing dehydrogenase [Filomicrobium insigne]|uniref:FAD/FMN-containing dehydrogenase n=1 Tax=Filomicrobium insigne TaxID=418854 RepID=A0A1H0NFB2_9HYPH|nr:FAD-binding and (Fe-S)-binding domain-containing protein [Filomicrobium insigne]SDO91291.1 FAD/FMN-containing dehydrogenase [Filomicrobium insigne]
MSRTHQPDTEGLERQLSRAIEGEILFDKFSRGRYATDASIYQMMPLGVVIPRTIADVEATLAIAREAGVPVLPRGGGTSQSGQTVNEAIVIDLSKHLNKLIEVDPEARTAVVEPGLVLDTLNDHLKPHGLWYPVDVSTSSRCTLGGMTANNSCGARSIRYGTSRDNVLAIDAILANGRRARFAQVETNLQGLNEADPNRELFRDLLALGSREAEEIRLRFPDIIRRVGGYNVDSLLPNAKGNNLAHLLVGSEGTLALSERITLKLSPILSSKVLGVCHFPTFYEAMDATQHLVKLDPTAVELVDSNMIELGRKIAMFKPIVDAFVRGEPAALLIVEFAEPDQNENLKRLDALEDLMADLGFRWGDPGKKDGGVVRAIDPEFQKQIIEVRKQGLNIMMSMKSEGKPVSFVEDCAVELKDLAEYTDRLTGIFRKHDTDGTWYAHASVGTLHVRPVLNLKLDTGVKQMRAIAEEAFELVRNYRGSHSGEHGDGIVRSEFHRTMFGERMVENFNWVKDRMDPDGLLNPGKIVRPPRMDDRNLLRYAPEYNVPEIQSAFTWSGHYGSGRGFQGAVEMCNNNGACRKLKDGVMCPSYRVTRNERDLVRGRANSLRLAISGQLGPNALTSDAMAETMKLCVSCKACRRECPTGVDMAKMKIDVSAARAKRHGLSLRDRMVAYLPHYAQKASRAAGLLNLRDRIPGAAWISERVVGMSAARPLPQWRTDVFEPDEYETSPADADVLLFADTFNRYFEPDNLRAAEAVLKRAGFQVAHATPLTGSRPLCCGRTFLSAGLTDQAAEEMRRTIEVIKPILERGGYVVGLEPSCLLTFRDEAPALLGAEWNEELGARVLLFEEFIARKHAEGSFELKLSSLPVSRALLHGHCHQKAFNVVSPVQQTLKLIPDLEVELIQTSCCGMAGAFGYQAETYEISRAMGELSLMPRIREAPTDAIVVADGTSCRHQIVDMTGREAVHVAQVLYSASNNV